MHKQNGWLISFKICRESIRKWGSDVRIFAIICLVFLFEWILIEPVRGVCDTYGLSISCWFFPFLFTNGIHDIFFYFGILLLFCDAPFVDNQQMDIILRAGKKNWFRGKILYLLVASCLYFLLIFVASIIEFLPNVGFSLEWEEVINKISLDSQYGMMQREIVSGYSPIEACLTQYIICVLFAFFLGLLIFYLNLFKNHNLGVGVALALVLSGSILNLFLVEDARFLQYFIPMVWIRIRNFVSEYHAVSFSYAVSFLCTGIAILIALIMHKAKTYSMECQEEM